MTIISNNASAALIHFQNTHFMRSFPCLSFSSAFKVISKTLSILKTASLFPSIMFLQSLMTGSIMNCTKHLLRVAPSSAVESVFHFLALASWQLSPQSFYIILSKSTLNLLEQILANLVKVKAQPKSAEPKPTVPVVGSTY